MGMPRVLQPQFLIYFEKIMNLMISSVEKYKILWRLFRLLTFLFDLYLFSLQKRSNDWCVKDCEPFLKASNIKRTELGAILFKRVLMQRLRHLFTVKITILYRPPCVLMRSQDRFRPFIRTLENVGVRCSNQYVRDGDDRTTQSQHYQNSCYKQCQKRV